MQCLRGRIATRYWFGDLIPSLHPIRPKSLRFSYRIQCHNTKAIYHRSFHTALPAALLPPLIFGGLVITLWAYKCFMMVLFQNKIIYMPGLPPNARREKISNYANQCSGIIWREERVRTSDGTEIALCIADVESDSAQLCHVSDQHQVYILYFQGNASSIPPRLPFISPVLRMLKESHSVHYVMVCVSYRGYWTSQGHPSERGIAEDAIAAVAWINSHLQRKKSINTSKASLMLWGQSIGAGVASNLASYHLISSPQMELKTVILETPFTSIREMLVEIYPQKWLPYRYLWPFLRSQLDSLKALERMRHGTSNLPNIVILEAGKDELVPKLHGEALETKCRDLGLDVQRHVIGGAFHTEVMSRPAGRKFVSQAIQSVTKKLT